MGQTGLNREFIMPQRNIQIQPLTVENFSGLWRGDQLYRACLFHINDAHTERYHAIVETEIQGEAKAGISIFRNIKATAVPFQIEMLERHPAGSQAFIPMQGQKFLIVVALASKTHPDQPDLDQIHAFVSDGSQG